jgi:holo-ACP synthase/triphosphoribosyl-dephospho-CoA synthase
MDFFTFQASAAALWPYFARCAAIGMETRELTPGEAFRKLRGPGLVAEGQMLRSTGGVNTHKGAIFSLGILCAAAGRLDEGDPARILAECARMTAGLTASDFAGLTPENAKTMGQKLYLRHGITGIRGQAEAGFPAVRDIGLPKLEAGLARGLDLNDAGCAALLAMLTETVDTNLIARSDYETQQRIAREIRVLLETEPFPDPQRLQELDRVFVEKNLSPGGTADLLALTYFLYFLKHAQR